MSSDTPQPVKEPTNSEIMKELGDVKRALADTVVRVRDDLTNQLAKVQGGIDSRTDTVLGRVAASRWSTSIVLGAAALCVFIGWLI